MTHAFFMTLGALTGVMVGLAVLVAGAQIILRLFISRLFWGIAASIIAICALLTSWDGCQRQVHLHSVEYNHEKATEAEAWHQLQQQYNSRFRKSKAET
jgi:uncharacterized protein Usg